MSTSQTIDPALLRAFAFIAEEGSFTRAAERIGRTQSAVSLQVQRLEALLGHTLLLRGKGGAVHLTSHGRYLLDQARELLALNDKIWTAFRAPALHGVVRLGCPDDYVLRFLPAVLRRFASSHPAVDVDVLCLPSRDLIDHLRRDELDLMICSAGVAPPRWETTPLWRGPLVWITSTPLPRRTGWTRCPWRLRSSPTPATGATSRRQRWTGWGAATAFPTTARPWLVPMHRSSPGWRVTVSNITEVPAGLRVLPDDGTLPPLGQSGIDLMKSRNARQPVTDVLADHIAETFRSETQRLPQVA